MWGDLPGTGTLFCASGPPLDRFSFVHILTLYSGIGGGGREAGGGGNARSAVHMGGNAQQPTSAPGSDLGTAGDRVIPLKRIAPWHRGFCCSIP